MVSARNYARRINGLRQRLEAAFLLLGYCPQCGMLGSYYPSALEGTWKVVCSTHGVVCSRTRSELESQMDIGFGIDEGLEDE
jgi:hypothetical protein